MTNDEARLSVDSVRKLLRGSERDAVLVAPDLAARLGSDPSSPETLYLGALVLVAWRRFREASAAFRALLANTQSPAPALLVDAGWAAHLANHPDALSIFECATTADAGLVDAEFGKAVVHLARGEHFKAREGFLRVLARDPAYPDAWLNLSEAELGLANVEAASIAAQHTVEQEPRGAAGWARLARVLKLQGHDEQAFQAYRQARVCELEAGIDVGTAAMQATAHYESGRYDEAIGICEGVLPDQPDAEANTAYALALLTIGRYVEGWRQYEFRWYTEPMRSTRFHYDRPPWVGQPLAGKSILLRAEQGIGDVVQFARYARPLKAQGARVILHVHGGMAKLAAGFQDVDVVVEKLEPPFDFDYYVNMMSLPSVFGTTLASMPSVGPYLSVDRERSIHWSGLIATKYPRVGLVWAGNPRHARDSERSIPLEKLQPLWNVDGVHFLSLQKEVRAADAPYMPSTARVEQLGPALHDLSDAAAVIDQLDLLITVDTALAHIAGAMGKPVWLLIPSHVDFRWLFGRDDSPWYPSVRLLRQSTRGDWDEVIERVVTMLKRLAKRDISILQPPPPVAHPPDQPATGISRVAETSVGIMQFLPNHDDEARSIARLGEYLSGELELVARLISPDAWVVEVGSGFGSHALWLGRTLGEIGEVFLYESEPIVERILRQNLAANSLSNAVTLPRGMLAGSARGTASNRTPLHTLDDLGLPRLDLLKICASNGEAILRGCLTTLWRLRPILLVRPTQESPRDRLRAAMSEAGYRVWRVRTRLFRTENHYQVSDDPFGGADVESLLGIPEEAESGTQLAHVGVSIEPLA